MVFELKRYVAAPGKFDALTTRFVARTLPIFERVGINIVNCWTAPDEDGVFYYMTRFDNEESRAKAWKAFGDDSEWREVKAASEVDGPLLDSQSTKVLVQAPFFTNS